MNFGDKHRSYSSFGVCAELSARGWLDHSFDRPEFNIQYRDSRRGGGSSITGRRRGMGGIPPPTWRAPATNWKLIMEAFARARTPLPHFHQYSDSGRAAVSRVIRKGNGDCCVAWRVFRASIDVFRWMERAPKLRQALRKRYRSYDCLF